MLFPLLTGLHIWNIAAGVGWFVLLSKRISNVTDKQDSGVLLLFAIAGALSIPLHYILLFFHPIVHIAPELVSSSFAYHMLIVGPTEELAKFLVFLAVVHAMSLPKEPQDGVIQGAIVGLMFGTIENIAYINFFGASVWLRPIIATGGHTIYGAVWGGIYSQAVYAHRNSYDPIVWQKALLGVFLVAMMHGLYNSVLSISPRIIGSLLSYLLDIGALMLSLVLFRSVIEYSPYRVYPLHRSAEAIPRLVRGLDFNPKSAIINRNLGLYLMHEGDYRKAAYHLRASIPRLKDARRARFFSSICDLHYVPEARAVRTLRSTWSALSDAQRDSYSRQLNRILAKDPDTLSRFEYWKERNFRKKFVPRRRGSRQWG